MTKSDSTLARLLREITDLLAALGDDVRDEEHALALLGALGVSVPAPPASLLAMGATVATVIAAADAYDQAAAASGPGSTEALTQLVALSGTAAEAFSTLLALGPILEADLVAYPGLLAEVDLALLARRLVEWALVTYLRRRAAPVYNALALLGVADPQVAVDEGEFARTHVRTQLRWERLKTAAQDPAALLADVYGWGTTLFDHREPLRRLHYLLQSLAAPVGSYPAGTEDAPALVLRLPLFAATGESGAVELGFALGPLESAGAATDTGLVFQPYAQGDAGPEVEPLPGWRIGISGAFAGEGLGVGLRPPLRVVLVGDVEGNARLVVTSEWRRSEGDPIVLVSQPDWFAITVAGFRAELQATIGDGGVPQLGVRLEVVGGQLTITPGEADGFLRQVVPPDGLRVAFDLGLAWSDEHGLRLVGSGGFEVTLPVQLSLGGILDVQAVHVALTAGADGGTATAAATFAVKLGPVRGTVERMGFALRLGPSPDGGNLGTFALGTRFQPPKGVGLVIDAGPLTGGGYVFLDPDKGQYAGVLQLEFKGIALKAVGLITTRMPDGTDGFSLLLIISAEFTPIQLGYGFTLSGVGGLVGVNRTAALDVLRAGIKARSLDSIMFPRDPVANAPQLISNLSAVFPPAQGRFLIGPMARLGWGTPQLLSLDLGLILELPAPVRLAVLGRLRMALPRDEAAVVVINMDVLGVLDFGRGEASVDATLYDSRIAAFTLTGDMAMRASWGERPGFALSAGGFHPRFQPPPGFPALNRLAISLCTGDNPRLRLESYLALTSNTVQFGARLELYAAALGFSIEGVLAFDALFQFEPFLLAIDIVGAVALKMGSRVLLGVSVSLSLTGPTPWHIVGRACFQLLFLTAEIGFDVRLGRGEPPPPPPPIEVAPLVEAALADPRNWSAQLPPAGESLFTLCEIPSVAGQLLLHPLGMLAVTQRVAPLGRTLERYGSSRVIGAAQLTITRLRVANAEPDTEPIEEFFAPAEFLDLTDDQKLARPSFERWEAGRRVRSRAVSYDTAQPFEADVSPEVLLVDDPDRPAVPGPGGPLPPLPWPRALAGGPAALALVRTAGTARFATDPLTLVLTG
ncbi:hypothetical protein ASF98_21480 [Arthrobacter sp. Leaf337]|uniref:DUF6603 domain-containing protein n=1 Tax=Arthrobacter sp. Leaf337 TaxID=1736342 RepID=UPI0006F4A582|nr:DUF6603 domain-containing protein [Arthrobacter sp. Leaf337]KQR77322.1 hypothetical protein ASF98_21480 [Arthrobacter sp. Leaf337]